MASRRTGEPWGMSPPLRRGESTPRAPGFGGRAIDKAVSHLWTTMDRPRETT
jgi:hypothetical protein